VLLGGHVQTSAHVLLAAAAYTAWRAWSGRANRRECTAWGLGIVLGLALASVEVVPLAVYLTRSPVWGDRAGSRKSPWVLERPRMLDAVCTALPYAFGSQRRGHPNLARAVGVHNLNESAGGYAGLATLVWLAPLAWSARSRQPQVGFLAGLAVFGVLGAFDGFPVANVVRAVPVLNVTDNRRLTLWVAFALVVLGGIGIEQLARVRAVRAGGRGWRLGPGGWLGLAAALVLGTVSVAVVRAEPGLRARAREHYARSAERTPGADPAEYRDRAERQVGLTLTFLPRYLMLAGGQLLGLVGLAVLARGGVLKGGVLRPSLLGLTLVDLLGFGFDLNPAIAAALDRPASPVIDYLRREVGLRGRILGLGQELPPNSLMRYGLSDARNYDSIELGRSLAWFSPLYEPVSPGQAAARTSRRAITWDGVLRAHDRLCDAAVCAVVGPSPPPPGFFGRVDRVGAVWIARLEGAPLASATAQQGPLVMCRDHGLVGIRVACARDDRIVVRETFDSSWRAEVDGVATPVEPYQGAFLSVPVAAGRHELVLRYDPPEVRLALATSVFALAAVVFALTGFCPFRSTRIIPLGLGRAQAVALESNV
jgi:hypothetical protein